jgi:adenosylcobinamide-GDP ribazoletransferase
MAVTVIRALPYAREDAEDGKAKPVAQGLSNGQLLVAMILGLAPLVALVVYTELWIYLTFLISLWLARWRLVGFFAKWIGGYTGDCLGATQQLAEVILYLSFVSLLWVSV